MALPNVVEVELEVLRDKWRLSQKASQKLSLGRRSLVELFHRHKIGLSLAHGKTFSLQDARADAKNGTWGQRHGVEDRD